MTGVTRLARTSVLILLLIGVFSPVPAFADVVQTDSSTLNPGYEIYPSELGHGAAEYLGNNIQGPLTSAAFKVSYYEPLYYAPYFQATVSSCLDQTYTGCTTVATVLTPASYDPLVVHDAYNDGILSFDFASQNITLDPSRFYKIEVSTNSARSGYLFKIYGSSADTYIQGYSNIWGLSDINFSLIGPAYVGTNSVPVLAPPPPLLHSDIIESQLDSGVEGKTADANFAVVQHAFKAEHAGPVESVSLYVANTSSAVQQFGFVIHCLDNFMTFSSTGCGVTDPPNHYYAVRVPAHTPKTLVTIDFATPMRQLPSGWAARYLHDGDPADYRIVAGQYYLISVFPGTNISVYGTPNVHSVPEFTPDYPGAEDAMGISAPYFSIQGICTTTPCTTTATTTPPTPTGPSSVLFLPGIESSRLYKPRAFCVVTSLTDCVDQLWEPNIDGDVQDLFMNPDGTSIRSDIYTKDVVDSYLGSGNTDVYKSFSTFMDSEVTAHKVAAWKAAPYDWRYGIDTVVNGGTLMDGKISYTGTATSSYLVDQVLALASSSAKGKVTIIAHSNGGLVAKLLVNKLKEMGRGDLIDKIVFVAVPQLGTPKAIPSILHGYEQANAHGLVTRLATARELARNSPGAYTLLPSESYTSKVATPTVLFDPNSITTAGFRSYYGTALDSQSELENFLTGSLDQRPQPVSFSDTDTPIRVSSALLTHAKEIETTLASWTPPTNTKVYEVAGVGLDTLSGITYKDSCVRCLIFTQPHLSFEENTVLDGDGTVVAASALAGTSYKYYFDLKEYKKINRAVNHATIMGASSVTDLVDSVLVASTTNPSTLPQFISASSPDFSQTKHLIYRIHSPVSLDLYDNQGRHTGIATTTLPDGSTLSYINNGIPGATYDEFGEVKYAFSDAETPLHIVMNGQASGYVTYDILEMTGNTVTTTTTFVNIPVATTTRISMDIQGSISTASTLRVDQNGDGVNEYNLVPKLNDIVEIPKPALQIVPDNREIQLGSSIGTFTAHLAGFQTGDTASSTVVGSVSCTTTATATSGVGVYPVTCTKGTLASDKYSFSSNAIGTLRIIYRFDGFLQPINDTAHQISLAKSVFKGGSTVPVKLQLKKADGTVIQSSTAPVWLAPQKGSAMSSPVDENVYPDAGTTGTLFKWDPVSQQYLYNWSTKGFASGYWYKIAVQIADGSIFTVVVGLR